MGDHPDPHAGCGTPGVIASAAYLDGRRVGDVPLFRLADVRRDHPDWFLWVGLYEPTEEQLRVVQAAFGLHDLAVEDAHKAHQRPKLESYGDGLFAVLRTAQLTDGCAVEFGETHVFLGPGYAVSVRHGSLVSHLGLRAKCEAAPAMLAHGPGYVLYALMDFVVDQYFPIVERFEADLAVLEEQIFGRRIDPRTAARVYRLKRDLLALKRAATPLVGISAHLMRTHSPLVPADTAVLFGDVHDHVLRVAETIDSVQELSSTALAANLSLVSVAQNEDTRRLAAWAAILAVPTMMAGIYGMNFENMPELKWEYGYPLVLGLMAGVCFLVYRGFRRSGWL
jgi:magnesium transporter